MPKVDGGGSSSSSRTGRSAANRGSDQQSDADVTLTLEQLQQVHELFELYDWVRLAQPNAALEAFARSPSPFSMTDLSPRATAGEEGPAAPQDTHNQLLHADRGSRAGDPPPARAASSRSHALWHELFGMYDRNDQTVLHRVRLGPQGPAPTPAVESVLLARHGECRALIDAALARMRQWKSDQLQRQREHPGTLHTGETDAVEPTPAALHSGLAESGAVDGDIFETAQRTILVPSRTAGVPFAYFAAAVLPSCAAFFFSPTASQSPTRVDGDRDAVDSADYLDAARQLFRSMDSDADGCVGWDDFTTVALLRAGGGGAGKRAIGSERSSRAASDASASAQPTASVATARSSNGAVLAYALDFAPTAAHSPWLAAYPLVRHLFHREPMQRLLVSERTHKYVTAADDGLVKLWKSDPRLPDAQGKPTLVHERNLLSAQACIADLALSPPSLGDAEVAAVVAMDGTVTLLRTATGEMVRSMLGVRARSSATAASVYPHVRNGASTSATILRVPYAVSAYRGDALEIFFGRANRFFHGLTVVPPPYEHLKRPVQTTSDLLLDFGVSPTESTDTAASTDCWFATAVALAKIVPTSTKSPLLAGESSVIAAAPREPNGSSGAAKGAAVAAATTEHAYLLLGFDSGLVQLFRLRCGWFSVNQLSATRVEAPAAYAPVYTTQLHTAAVSKIIVCEASDLLMTCGNDGTVCVRLLSRLESPFMRLGSGALVPPRPWLSTAGASASALASARQPAATLASPASSGTAGEGGHTKRIACAAWHAAHQLLVTGGCDHLLIFWTPRTQRPLRVIDLRTLRSAAAGGADDASAPSLGATGHPVDVSFFSANGGGRGADAALPDALRLLVLDSRRVLRVLDALSGQLLTVLQDSADMEMSVARFDSAQGRLVLGGRYPRTWNLRAPSALHADGYAGHRQPVLLLQHSRALSAYVSADEEHVCVWKAETVPNEVALTQRSWRRRARELLTAIRRQHEERQRSRAALLARAAAAAAGTACANGDAAGTLDVASCAVDAPAPRATPLDFEDDFPTLEGSNPYNQAYVRCCSRLVRTWTVPEGIRAAVLTAPPAADVASGRETDVVSPNTESLFVALLREPALVQYNLFSGSPLRTFAYPVASPVAAMEVAALCAALVREPGGGSVRPVLCAAFEESLTSARAAIYPLTRSSAAAASAAVAVAAAPASVGAAGPTRPHSGRRTVNRDAGGAAAPPSAPSRTPPQRTLVFRDSSAASVELLPEYDLIAVGGQGTLFLSPIHDLTTHARACSGLTEGGTSATAPAQLTALTPGRLVAAPSLSALTVPMPSTGDVSAPRGTTSGGGGSDSGTGAASDRDAAAAGFFSSAAAAGVGFLGHLCRHPRLPWVLSGSNHGLVQLWDVRSASERVRFGVTVTAETITAMTLHRSDGGESTLLAVGSPSGLLALLDLSEWALDDSAPGRPPLADASTAPAAASALARSVVLLDRWHAHVQDVHAISFVRVELSDHDPCDGEAGGGGRRAGLPLLPAARVRSPTKRPSTAATPAAAAAKAFATVTLATAGEDSFIYLWRWQARALAGDSGSGGGLRAGMLSCLGCFGGGGRRVVGLPLPVSPPLLQLPARTARVFDEARALYVLQRLVVEGGLFLSRATARQRELQEEVALRTMETDARRLTSADAAWGWAWVGSVASREEADVARTRKERDLRHSKTLHLLEKAASLGPEASDSQTAREAGSVNGESLLASYDDVAGAPFAAVFATSRTDGGASRTSLGADFASAETLEVDSAGFFSRGAFADEDDGDRATPTLFDAAGLEGGAFWRLVCGFDPSAPADARQGTVAHRGSASSQLPPSPIAKAGGAVPLLVSVGSDDDGRSSAGSRSRSRSSRPHASHDHTFYPVHAKEGGADDCPPSLTTPAASLSGSLMELSPAAQTLPPGAQLHRPPGSPHRRISALPGFRPVVDVNSAAVETVGEAEAGTTSATPTVARNPLVVPYVMSFMRGTYAEASARECLRRTVHALQPEIRCIRHALRRLPHAPPPDALTTESATAAAPTTATTTAARVAASERGAPTDGFATVPLPVTPHTTTRAAAAAHTVATAAAESPVSTGAGGGGAGALDTRASLRVKFSGIGPQTNATPVVHLSSPSPWGAASVDRVEEDGEPTARGSFAAARASQSFVRAASSAVEELPPEVTHEIDDVVLDGEEAARVVEVAYRHHRKAEALQLLADRQRLVTRDALTDHSTSNSDDAAAAAAAAVGEANFFSATGTTRVLFGQEAVLVDECVAAAAVARRHRVATSGLVKAVAATLDAHAHSGRSLSQSTPGDVARDGETDWYGERERRRRERQGLEALWQPARVVRTLMSWSAPVTGPATSEPAAGQAGSAVTRSQEVPHCPALTLPSLLPATLFSGDDGAASRAGAVPGLERLTVGTTDGVRERVAAEVALMKERRRQLLQPARTDLASSATAAATAAAAVEGVGEEEDECRTAALSVASTSDSPARGPRAAAGGGGPREDAAHSLSTVRTQRLFERRRQRQAH